MVKHQLAYSFWGFGLLNNLLYVVILSAAIDLVGNSTPKGVVLLADVLPSFLFKSTAPFYFHVVPYNVRIGIIVALSFLGMQLVAHSSHLALKLVGIIMASFSSGIGEVTFLQLTHYFNQTAINAWSSGTGAAGLVGSFLFLVATTWIKMSTPLTLSLFSFMPFILILLYKFVLPPFKQQRNSSPSAQSAYILNGSNEERRGSAWSESETDSLAVSRTNTESTIDLEADALASKAQHSRLKMIKSLLVPFILPLMTVYVAEYVINQGISPTLLFDLKDMPMFSQYRDAYVMYGTLYQVGVFISRSSATVIRIRKLWLMAALQALNVVLAVLQSMFMINPTIYVSFIFMVYEGLLGGAAYVNTFMLVSETIPQSDREFAMGAVTMSDSSGVVLAALISMWLEPSLCHYQINDGRPWCRLN